MQCEAAKNCFSNSCKAKRWLCFYLFFLRNSAGLSLDVYKRQVLLYSSTDLEHFTFEQLYTTEKAFGYMWECPDIFVLDGHRILAVCPQGIPSEAEQYQNIYQSGYFIETEETRTVNASFKGTEETRTVDASFKGTKETRTVNPSFIEWDMGRCV